MITRSINGNRYINRIEENDIRVSIQVLKHHKPGYNIYIEKRIKHSPQRIYLELNYHGLTKKEVKENYQKYLNNFKLLIDVATR